MFRRLIFPKEVTDQEARRLAQPAAVAIMLLCGLLILAGGKIWLAQGSAGMIPILFGLAGIVYGLILLYVIVPSSTLLQRLKWPVTLANAVAISIGVAYLPPLFGLIPHTILVLVAVTMIIIWERTAAYTFLVLALIFHLVVTDWTKQPDLAAISDFGFFLLAGVLIETIQRLVETHLNRIKRLEAINDFARQVGSSLDTQEVLSLVGEAIRKAIPADTYFFGLIEDGQIHVHMLYDEGEYFHPSVTPIEGTLSGWVVRNQRSLFVPDFRSEVNLEGVKLVLLGKGKTNLCWMGTPMRAENVNGVMVVASYTPNDFNRTDLELLENLAQHAAQAISNTLRHAEVEAQSRLDSLTGAYNHGYIVHVLNHEAEKSLDNKTPLSLIMLDIDHFKQYNDKFGHLVGDQVLAVLMQAIRQHIKATDSIGRWGGEEFSIVLPETTGPQAQLVADRVRETVNSLSLHDRDGKTLPFPTVSQGLAVYPDEASQVDKLIDLADQRLYIAKERGRNQIEPKAEHWKYLK